MKTIMLNKSSSNNKDLSFAILSAVAIIAVAALMTSVIIGILTTTTAQSALAAKTLNKETGSSNPFRFKFHFISSQLDVRDG